jgi:hypothetical protein
MMVFSLYTGGNLILMITTCDLHKERGSSYVFWDRFEEEFVVQGSTNYRLPGRSQGSPLPYAKKNHQHPIVGGTPYSIKLYVLGATLS